MIDLLIAIMSTIGATAILVAAIGINRMPDFFLRLSVTVKAATLGAGLLLFSAAIYFPQVSVTTKAFAIMFFLILTAPVSAHMIGRAAYFIGTPMWDKSVRDDLKGKYDHQARVLKSSRDIEKEKEKENASPASQQNGDTHLS